jgi:hypothetical protein
LVTNSSPLWKILPVNVARKCLDISLTNKYVCTNCTASWFQLLVCHYQTVNERTGETGIGSQSSSVGNTALHIKHTCLLFYFYHSKIHEAGTNVKEHIITNLQEKNWHKVHLHWHMCLSVYQKGFVTQLSPHFFNFLIKKNSIGSVTLLL